MEALREQGKGSMKTTIDEDHKILESVQKELAEVKALLQELKQKE
jgi:hypothetical protein